MGNCLWCGEKNVDHRHYAGCQGLKEGNEDKKKIGAIESKVLLFLGEGTQKGIVALEDTLESLGYDSVDAVSIVVEMEESYDISIPDEEYENWKTGQDVVNSVLGATS